MRDGRGILRDRGIRARDIHRLRDGPEQYSPWLLARRRRLLKRG